MADENERTQSLLRHHEWVYANLGLGGVVEELLEPRLKRAAKELDAAVVAQEHDGDTDHHAAKAQEALMVVSNDLATMSKTFEDEAKSLGRDLELDWPGDDDGKGEF
jgi:translation initiation factor 2 beta subunit (eIF-2beta)/eIF-5